MYPPILNDSTWAVSGDCVTEIRRKVEIVINLNTFTLYTMMMNIMHQWVVLLLC